MKFTKRIILVMLFFISALTFTSFVKHTEVNAEGEAFEIVETGVKYADFATAKSAASSGQTIKLLQDYEYTGSGSTMNKDLTIDFSDYTLTITGSVFLGFDDTSNYTLTLKASGNGGISTSKTVVKFYYGYSSEARFNIESGEYNRMAITCEYAIGSTISLASDGFVATSGLSGKINITGGKFYMPSTDTRNTLSSFVASRSFTKTETLGSGTNRQVLDVTPETYITDENTKASVNIAYEPGYYVYRKVTSLSASDSGKKYLIAYVNESEDVIHIMKNYSNITDYSMYTDNHTNVNATNDGTWYINSDSEFKGNPNENYFVTLGWSGNGFTFSVDSGAKLLCYYTDSTKVHFEPVATATAESNGYNYSYRFSDVDDFFYPLSNTNTCLAYTPTTAGSYKNYFRVIATSYETITASVNQPVRAHLFEAVKIDPVVNASSIRFGTGITKDMYDFLSNAGTSVSFGVIAKGTTALGGAELTYDNASIKKTITPARVASIGAAVEDLEGDYYQFALVLDGITEATYNKSITARVYVCVDGEYYYMNESVYSLQTLAAAYFNAADTSAYTEHLDVLEYLKDYVG